MSVITQDGDSALIMAVMHGYTDVIVGLVKAKANLDLQNKVCSKLTLYIHSMVINPRCACARNLQYLSCVCVCVSVCLLAL